MKIHKAEHEYTIECGLVVLLDKNHRVVFVGTKQDALNYKAGLIYEDSFRFKGEDNEQL